MDVTCDKCGAEYEFDETLLGDKGATVKCSSCQHVFRVLGRKEPGRPALKLRFAKSGRVETLSSLRELQLRVRNGEVSADDLLGRDGFEYRRLGDVPELKNFFARPTGPSGTLRPDQAARHVQVSETSMPPASKENSQGNAQDKAVAKRTMVGVGPLNPHIPGPPRVPNIPGGLPPPSARPAAAAPEPARLGPAPISSVPTNPNARSPAAGVPVAASPAAAPMHQPSATSAAGGYEPRRAPVSQAPTTQGSVPQAAHTQHGMPQAAPYAATQFASEAPAIARPLGNTPRSLDGAGAAGAPASKPAPGMKLYLSEDEAPPARATAGSSKIWVYAGLAVLLGGAGYVGVTMLNKSDAGAEPAPAAAPRVETPAPAPGSEQPPATPPVAAQPGSATAQAPTTPTPPNTAGKPEAAQAPSVPAAQPAQAAAAEDDDADRKGKGRESRGSSGGATSGKDPTDYSGWVSRGDQLTSRGDLEGARKAYESALALRGTGSEANTGLGFALLAEGKARDAIPHFDRAADSGYAEANIGLGDAYRKLGQKSSAIEAYQNYLERLPTGSKANYARTQIETLKGGSSNEAREPPPAAADDYKPAGEMEAPAAPQNEQPSGESTP
ncbi:MAG: zinc-ribbon domain-containing protein [Myxococcales bacterium]